MKDDYSVDLDSVAGSLTQRPEPPLLKQEELPHDPQT